MSSYYYIFQSSPLTDIRGLEDKPLYESWYSLDTIERASRHLHDHVLSPLCAAFWDRSEGAEIPEFPEVRARSVDIAGGVQSIYNAADALAADYCTCLSNFPNTAYTLLTSSCQFDRNVNFPITSFGVRGEPCVIQDGILFLPSAMKYHHRLAWTLLAHEVCHPYVETCFDPDIRDKFPVMSKLYNLSTQIFEKIANVYELYMPGASLNEEIRNEIGYDTEQMICDIIATLIAGEFFVYSLAYVYRPHIIMEKR